MKPISSDNDNAAIAVLNCCQVVTPAKTVTVPAVEKAPARPDLIKRTKTDLTMGDIDLKRISEGFINTIGH